MKGPFKRRRYPIVSRRRQYRMLLLILFYACSLSVVLFIGLFVPDILVIKDDTANFYQQAAAADRLLSLHARLWPAVAAVVCLIGLHSFRMFARFIGPLFRFRWAFEGVAAGEMTRRIHLRAGDELIGEADAFNAMMDQLTESIRQVKTATAVALATARQVAAAAAGDPGAETAIAPLAVHLATQIDDIEAQLGRFIVETPPAGAAS